MNELNGHEDNQPLDPRNPDWEDLNELDEHENDQPSEPRSDSGDVLPPAFTTPSPRRTPGVTPTQTMTLIRAARMLSH